MLSNKAMPEMHAPRILFLLDVLSLAATLRLDSLALLEIL